MYISVNLVVLLLDYPVSHYNLRPHLLFDFIHSTSTYYTRRWSRFPERYEKINQNFKVLTVAFVRFNQSVFILNS